MEQKLMSVPFYSQIVPIKPINNQFTLCKCYVMALGKNDNGTIFDKKNVDNALQSLYNIPVVGHLYNEEETNELIVGGHDIVVERINGEGYGIKSVTVPFGTVPEDCNAHYEEVDEGNGVKNTYLVADIILWTGRYPDLLNAKYSDEIYFAQSMEIIPREVKKTKNGIEVLDFQFSALCLLGKSDDKTKNVEPCFKSAKVEPYVFTSNENFIQLYERFKEEMAQINSVDLTGKGGKEMNKEVVKSILLEFGLEEDCKLPFEIDESMTEDMLREKLSEMNCSENNASDEGNVEGEEQPVEEFSLQPTYNELFSKLDEEISKHYEGVYVYVMDFDMNTVYIGYVDYDKEKFVERKNYKIPYTLKDGNVEVDYDNAEEIFLKWLTKEEIEIIEKEKEQLEELVEYKKNRENADKKAAVSEVIEKFSDLSEIDEYKTLVKSAMEFEDINDLIEKFYAIRGRYAGAVEKKPLNQVRIPVSYAKSNNEDEFDEFMARYSKK